MHIDEIEEYELIDAERAYVAYCEEYGWKSTVLDMVVPRFEDIPYIAKMSWVAVVRALKSKE